MSPKISITCHICEKQFSVFPYRKREAKYCSKKCMYKGVGEAISNGKSTGLPRLSTQGYWFIHRPNHPRANKQGYVKLCDLIYERYKRPLHKNEILHHIDECKTNDHPDNLQPMTKRTHDLSHIKVILKEEEVVDIRKRKKEGEDVRKIAKEYGVSVSNIYTILQKRTWKHI